MRLQVGDKLRILGALGFYHYGIYIGAWGNHPGCVVHNAKFKTVEITTLEAFAAGREVELVERGARNRGEGAGIVERALSLVGQNYDLVGFNCEHVANYAITGQAVSPTVTAVTAVAALVGIVLLVRSGS